MYRLQEKPDKEIILENGGKLTPLATLKNKYGGMAHICIDDHCYVLYLERGGERRKHQIMICITTHWFKEAVAVLKTMSLPK